MARPKRKDSERDEIRGSILNVAMSVARREGLQGLTLRLVAKEARYSPASIYEYFSDKDALLVAMACQTCNQLYDRLCSLEKSDSAAMDLMALMQATIDFHAACPESSD